MRNRTHPGRALRNRVILVLQHPKTTKAQCRSLVLAGERGTWALGPIRQDCSGRGHWHVQPRWDSRICRKTEVFAMRERSAGESEKKSAFLGLYLSPMVKEQVRQAAEDQGVSISEVVRQLILRFLEVSGKEVPDETA